MPISMPTEPTWRAGKFRLASNAARFSSPITRTIQSVGRPGDYWLAQMELPPLSRWEPDLVAEWSAFLAIVAGGRETMYVRPPVDQRHDIDGTPQVDGANQVGMEIKLKSLSNGDRFERGSFICYQTATFRMLHIVTATVTAGGSGLVDLPIAPAIRKSPANNAAVNFLTPTCEMMLTDPSVDVLDLSDPATYGLTLNLTEAVRE